MFVTWIAPSGPNATPPGLVNPLLAIGVRTPFGATRISAQSDHPPQRGVLITLLLRAACQETSDYSSWINLRV